MIRRAYMFCAVALTLALLFSLQTPAIAAPIASKADDIQTTPRQTD